ncbi:UDP-glucose dehydrogenase family protein [Stratiformator vulcanicus]|uniref:UDP-glucose 6-dehydrogenase n=1 Tax=Stratiformator vulcanicus TaxID=2527980 RepID=A0A517R2E3_9PLAN|nr:UDP-glucose/GDP-mannose dehydrogenase family protein [Stratiformator vulcanicus]QDT38049.1 UDP-glucose 6-dehydrogenase [Stratiformator vulcanicus]
MKITVIGTGYVGLVTGTCLADSGQDVTCLDIDEGKIERLNAGEIPIYEPGLTELVTRNHAAKRLTFTTDYAASIPSARCVFIAVGTPQGDDGSANLSGLWAVVETIAPLLAENAIVVIKSTVPVGTNRKTAARLAELTGRNVDVASNPEFLKEGAAIDDFTKPDRIVVGVDRPEVAEVLKNIHKPFLRNEHPFLAMGWESAEMTKYVANCMLATKISFINEMANLCEHVGADVNEVRRGIGHDARIGFKFLFPGVGYGGSCFPKDVRALIRVADDNDMTCRMLAAVDEVNDVQKHVLGEKLYRYFDGDLSGKTIAVWGLAFKPRTDDIREAPALVLIDRLLSEGASVRVHDPVAMKNVKAVLGDKVAFCEHHYDAAEGADAVAICTEWNEYRMPDWEFLRHKMKNCAIFDGRNLFDPAAMRDLGIWYTGIGLAGDDMATPTT